MRRVGRWGTGLWLLAAAVVLLWPVPVDRPLQGPLIGLLRWLHAHGAPGWLDYQAVEWTANVLLFAPLGAFLVLALLDRVGGWSVLVALAVGASASLAAELVQGVALPARFASIRDVGANALGTLLAAAVTVGVVAALRARSARRGR